MTKGNQISAAMTLLAGATTVQADWSTVRGDARRMGFVQTTLRPPFRLSWVRHFVGERLGTAMEPIVADGKLFVATHNGNLYALDAQSGRPLWRFQANGQFLHSPAFADGFVATANTDGYIYALDAETGEMSWSVLLGYQGGFAASPLVVGKTVFNGERAGAFFAVDLSSGEVIWENHINAPVRQTAAFAAGRVFVTTEDMRVWCMDTKGAHLWISEPLIGQTARDYYPVIVEVGGRSFVIVRTNPVVNMAKLIGQDRRFLCELAGVDDSSWQNVDAWTKSEQARGNPELWEKEQEAIVSYLDEHPEARTFFVLDAETGEEAMTPPVLWCSGCQGVGTPPVVFPDGRLLVFYRSAYGNWNHGVAPLVALGLLDLTRNRITPRFHAHGMRPPWNTFWGTADESQNFVVAGDTVLVVHQGTLSGFDLTTQKLFLIAGNRDTWGGFHNPPWARNEWHGPARGGVAVVGNRIYWLTGSRIICITAGESGIPAEDVRIDSQSVPTQQADNLKFPDYKKLKQMLAEEVAEFLSQRWAPLYLEPGLAGREFFFDDSGEVFEALAWSFPHLPVHLQEQVKKFLDSEWQSHPPFAKDAWCVVNEGERREHFWIPPEALSRSHREQSHHPFGNLYAVWLYAERCDEWARIFADWDRLRTTFGDFLKTGWQLNSEQGALFANRYLSSLLAFADMAERYGDADMIRQAREMAEQTSAVLVEWWRKQGEDVRLPVFQNISEWDAFIGSGDALFFRVISHKAKLALFHDLTPEIATLVRLNAPEAVDKLWRAFETLCTTWYLAGEERQIHYGENFIDPPDFALDAFKTLAWLKEAPTEELIQRLDIPFCRADLTHLTKLAIIFESGLLATKKSGK